MLYIWLKFIHIISSTILFGTGIGTACVMLYGHMTKETHIIAATTRYVVLADWVFTGSSGIIQPLTGFWMVYLAGYSLQALWLAGAIIGYIITAICWFIVVYLQIKMRDFVAVADQQKIPLPAAYFRYFKYWFYLGFPAFFSLIGVFYLMTAKLQ